MRIEAGWLAIACALGCSSQGGEGEETLLQVSQKIVGGTTKTFA